MPSAAPALGFALNTHNLDPHDGFARARARACVCVFVCSKRGVNNTLIGSVCFTPVHGCCAMLTAPRTERSQLVAYTATVRVNPSPPLRARCDTLAQRYTHGDMNMLPVL